MLFPHIRLQVIAVILKALTHYISLLTTRCRRGCVERHSIMSKCKFQEELARHVEEPFLPHLVPELEMKKKKQKLPPPPVIGRRPFLDMKLNVSHREARHPLEARQAR